MRRVTLNLINIVKKYYIVILIWKVIFHQLRSYFEAYFFVVVFNDKQNSYGIISSIFI